MRTTPDDGTLREQLGTGAEDIAKLVPELRTRFTDLPVASEAGGEQARFRLYDAASRFLSARAADARCFWCSTISTGPTRHRWA